MTPWKLRVILGLYPRRWRTRYGGELEQIVADLGEEARPSPILLAFDLLLGGIRERVHQVVVPGIASALGTAALIGAIAVGMFRAPAPLVHARRQAPASQLAATARLAQSPLAVAHGPGTVVSDSMTGAAVQIVLDTNTGRVVSVHRAGG